MLFRHVIALHGLEFTKLLSVGKDITWLHGMDMNLDKIIRMNEDDRITMGF